MPFTEDLTPFFADFGVPVTIAGGQPVQGIFDNAYQSGGAGAWGIATTQPAVTLATAHVPANPVDQPVLVAGVSYTVVAHQPDGTGLSVLILESAAP